MTFTDEQIDAGVSAWFGGIKASHIIEPHRVNMRAALVAIQSAVPAPGGEPIKHIDMTVAEMQFYQKVKEAILGDIEHVEKKWWSGDTAAVKCARAIVGSLRPGNYLDRARVETWDAPPAPAASGWRTMDSAPRDGTRIVCAAWDAYNKMWRFTTDHWRVYSLFNPGLPTEGWGPSQHGLNYLLWLPSPPAQGEDQ